MPASNNDNSLKKIYTLGSIIHNPGVVKELSKKGLLSVKTPENIDPGNVFIVRSHGMSPKILKKLEKKKIKIIDATCPYVKKAQAKAKKLEKQGYFIVVIGNRNHPEVVGIKEQVNDSNVAVIENVREIADLDFKKKILVA